MTRTQQFAVETALYKVNQGRRTRTIGLLDLARAIENAKQFGTYGFADGGTVANAYKYRATTAAVYCIQFAKGHFALCIGEKDARRSASDTTWATGATVRDIDGQRAAFGPRTDARPFIHLTARQAQDWIEYLGTMAHSMSECQRLDRELGA